MKNRHKAQTVLVHSSPEMPWKASGVYAIVSHEERTFYVGRAINSSFAEHIGQAARFRRSKNVSFQAIAVGKAGSFGFNDHKQAAIRSLEAAGYTKLNKDHWSDYL